MLATTPPNAAPNTGSTEDALGYDAYAKTLWARIEQGLNRDAITGKLGDDPLVVGIFGEWGAGKSFLLNSIRSLSIARLAEQKALQDNDPGVTLTIPVWFQAWKYEHEAHLHVPLLLHVMNALKDALREPPSIAGQLVEVGTKAVVVAETIAKPAGKLLKAANAVFPVVQKVIGSVSVFGVSLNIPDEIGDWLETAADAAKGVEVDEKDDAADKKKQAEKARKDPKSHVATATEDGLCFYRIHELLAALTRPGKYEGRKDLFDGAKVTKETRINFVVFVDDLDRCLPEKAVAVLELIKTVFNVESFAFVLALDDEVIERGIGYRYKDYALGNKKSEMPITGFEYLEKIVHLPFRLPALTYADALRFLQRKEQALLKLKSPHGATARRWFSPVLTLVDARRQPSMAYASDTSSMAGASAAPDRVESEKGRVILHKIELNLAQLVLAAFDGYVPRKLDRVVELFHQVVNIAAERGRPLGVALGDDADPRVVLALVLLQLFQPELYRCLKRTGNGFDVLRDSMRDNTLSPVFSDQDLLHWACYGIRPPLVENAEARSGEADTPPINIAETLRRIAKLGDSERYPAQRIRLPIVERMLEHRAAQRHVFDPLKLFAELNKSFADVPLTATDTRSYYSLLTLERVLGGTEAPLQLTRTYTVEVPQTMTDLAAAGVTGEKLAVTLSDPPPPAAAHVVVLTDLRSVYAALISAEASDQTDVANRAGLQPGAVLAASSAAELFALVNGWINNKTPGSAAPTALKQQLLRGLLSLAPHLAKDDAQRFWALVSDCVTLPIEPNTLLDKPKVAALYADVRAALGQDDRFDPVRPYRMRERFAGHRDDDEPILGFVRVPPGKFMFGHRSQKDNPPREMEIKSAFYMARTLTTVAQYARFVDAKGYQPDDTIWDRSGTEWLKKRAEGGAPKASPGGWIVQLKHLHRPVINISWFEARAYARWLSGQLRGDTFKGCEARLPTELQWERAARALNLSHAHTEQWPWGEDGLTVGQRASVNSTNIGQASTVGVFAPTAIGLHDMAGSAWEWTDNRYEQSHDDSFNRISKYGHLGNNLSDSVSLRGGSWSNHPELARCSFRYRFPPDVSNNDIGLRVVLSLG
jgi:formylglycine-generating enzyme required for sulfatase activity